MKQSDHSHLRDNIRQRLVGDEPFAKRKEESWMHGPFRGTARVIADANNPFPLAWYIPRLRAEV